MAEEPLLDLPGHIRPRWTERRAAQVRVLIQQRTRRRRMTGWTVAAGSLVLAGCLLSVLFTRGGLSVEIATHGAQASPSARVGLVPSAKAEPSPTAGQTPSPSAGSPMLAAEPVATPLTADTELIVDPQGGGRAFVLRRGSARFVVAHDEHHPFRVRVGPLVVEDLGTIFSVTRVSDGRFDVGVEEGNVAVLCGDSRVELGHGQRQTFECGAPEKPENAAPQQHKASGTALPSPKTATPAQRPAHEATWKSLAERGQYGEAYDSLRGEGQSSVHDETLELLLAADTARLSGHPAEAVPYLRRVLAVHATDPRADLAAFTLGRVLLDELGRPAEAAAAFERARSPRAPLAEDALAREVEARARAGDAQGAHALALEYRRTYPHGRRTRVVAKFGGLE